MYLDVTCILWITVSKSHTQFFTLQVTCWYQMEVQLWSSINSRDVRDQWSPALQKDFCGINSPGESSLWFSDLFSLSFHPQVDQALGDTNNTSEEGILIPGHSLLTLQWGIYLPVNQIISISNSTYLLCSIKATREWNYYA